ncbi:BTAD domain-containing putative transcriptional regulator [Nocardiopsis mangrovi]|uniref:BTAD domain-containing putative transcriptional regulator n=1 Tax=Nocardiopsis mangrovi TaxID=1179818 RepID=A0ABV9DSH8_9ACTN
MRFGVLGPLEVWRSDGGPLRVPEVKVRTLLGVLLVHEGRPAAADALIDVLWGDALPANPARVLRSKLSQLRAVLEQAEPGGRSRVVRGPAGYRLAVGPDDVDAARFRALAERARATADPRERATLLGEGLALWRGPALADFADAPFAAATAARLEEERLTAHEQQAEARLGLGEHHLLADELGDLAAAHPLRERLRGLQMRALYRSGRQAEALEAFGGLRAALADELGVDPGPEVARLHTSILRQDSGLAPEYAAEAPAPHPRSNLPTALTPVIGREAHTREVRALLRAGRLVTLTGPGGVGKTRLAVEAADGPGAGTDAHDGVWLVELGALRPGSEDGATAPARVAEAVASVIGVRDHGDSGPADAAGLGRALRDSRMLLILDNCEHIVGAAAELARTLLRGAPRLRVLATGRQPLGIPGEHVYEVPPLAAPPEDAPLDTAHDYEEYSAVRLFTARARAAAPNFTLDRRTAPAVADLCRRLDGLPLALELAANRVRALGVRELAARLDDRFALLSAEHAAAPARQRTLRAVIDWSWDLLTEPERVVLRRMAPHSEGFTLDAAEAVAAGGPLASGDVVAALSRLVERSLVGAVDGPGGVRYRLLESITAYAAARLEEAGETGSAAARHLHHYRSLAERADPLLRGRDQQRWLGRLDAESANLRTALDTALRRGAAEDALRLSLASLWHRYLRGRLGEAHRALTAALAVPGGPPALRAEAAAWQTGLDLMMREPQDPVAIARAALDGFCDGDPGRRARVRWFLGTALLEFGELTASEELVADALEVFGDRDDRWGVAAALCTRAWLEQARGRLVRFEIDAERGLELFRSLGDQWGQLQALPMLGHRSQIAGDYAEAARRHREGLRIAERLGLWSEVSYRLSELGRVALLTGDHEGAARFHERARRLAADRNDRFGERFAELGLGLGARRAGRFDEAERHLSGWLERTGDSPGPAAVALVLAELGFAAEQRGDAETALRRHREGMAAARSTGDPRAIALALEGLAGAQALLGDAVEGARLLGAADAARASVGAPLPAAEQDDVRRVRDAARAALGGDAFSAEFEHGRAAGDQWIKWSGPTSGNS